MAVHYYYSATVMHESAACFVFICPRSLVVRLFLGPILTTQPARFPPACLGILEFQWRGGEMLPVQVGSRVMAPHI